MKKQTLTIGIPAHNEGKNIGNLLQTIISQKQVSYHLEFIIVVCDGCSDNTAQVVRDFAKKYPQFNIKLLNFHKRLGKAVALNKIYSLSNTDLLLTFDADVALERNIEVELMVKEMQKDKRTTLVGGRFIPVKATTLMGKFSYISYVSFEDAFLKLSNGKNMYALVGAASLMRRNLYKSFTYPRGVVSDQNYLYVMATRDNKYGFKLAKDTRILIRIVGTFKDWRILGARAVVADKASVANFFGEKILKQYFMPRKLYFMSLFKWFLKSPAYSLGSLFMNMYIRTFPYRKAVHKNGTWELAISSKEGIKI
ncbi:MAG TPA: glycosyltransferase family 2 protein [Candidatus Bathyarchaeia archaeon]|nr:glycosyltransferase family 2 protein [Candidatus Bathyarchaeia archaeon]